MYIKISSIESKVDRTAIKGNFISQYPNRNMRNKITLKGDYSYFLGKR